MAFRLMYTGALSMAAVAAIETDYAGFVHFYKWSGDTTTIAAFTMPDGRPWAPDFAKDICSADTKCQVAGYGGRDFNSLNVDEGHDVFLAYNATIVRSAICTIEQGGTYFPSTEYLSCVNDFPNLDPYIANTYALPPDVIHTTCLDDPACIGFRVKNDLSSGDILHRYVDYPGLFRLSPTKDDDKGRFYVGAAK